MVLEIMIQFVEEEMMESPNKYHCARMLLNDYAQKYIGSFWFVLWPTQA